MTAIEPPAALESWYHTHIGDATTNDEVTGYWLFVAGVVLGMLGILAVFLTAPATTPRGVGYALLALSPVLITLGAVIRFPLRRAATLLAGLGTLICLLAVLWFLVIFPEGWSLALGDTGVILTYALGLLVLAVAGAFVPLLTDPVRDEHATLQRDAAATSEAFETSDRERSETSERATDLEAQLAAREGELEAIRTSQARFELFDDAAGEHRWRLRHRNGNVIATSGEGYTRRHNAQKGMQSVRRNALGAGTLRIDPETADEDGEPDDADEPEVAVPSVAETVESRATFERYEDAGGEWRWRLRHDNGNVLADSGEGYASKSNLTRAVKAVREHVVSANYLEIDPVAYELYRDRASEWRWRLLHENGSILADSGEGYSSRAAARNGVESVRANIADAEVEEQ